MTRDEARAILAGRYIVNIDGEEEYCEKVNEALDMAIEALSNQQKWIDEELQNYLIEHADLVTCKDCRYKRLMDDEETKYYYCALKAHEEWSVDETDFCSWGERREP